MDPMQARQRQLQGSRPLSRVSSTRTAYKIRGNGEPTLPIEDWAKGISRAFSRRKKSFLAEPAIVEQPEQTAIPILDVPQPKQFYTLSARTTNSELSSDARVYPESPDAISYVSTANWVQETSLERPVLKPRSPRRSLLFIESTIYQAPQVIPEHNVSTPMSSGSSRSSGSIADWRSETNTDQSIHDLAYQNQMNQPVELPSEPCANSASLPERTSSLPKATPQVELDSTDTAVITTDLSLRTLFFGGVQTARGRPRSLSIASSHFSTHSQALSRASSVLTFTTALESSTDITTESQIENPSAEVESTEMQTQSIVCATAAEPDCPILSIPASHKEVDTQVDEDGSVYEDDAIFEDVIRSYNTAVDEAKEERPSADTIPEESAFEHCVPGDGSLADVLFEVASSTPYTGSDLDDTSSVGNLSASDRVEVSSQSSHEEDTASQRDSRSELNKSFGFPDTGHESITQPSTTASLYEYARPRVPRQYKMINGTLVAFEPWRLPGQSDLSRYNRLS